MRLKRRPPGPQSQTSKRRSEKDKPAGAGLGVEAWLGAVWPNKGKCSQAGQWGSGSHVMGLWLEGGVRKEVRELGHNGGRGWGQEPQAPQGGPQGE